MDPESDDEPTAYYGESLPEGLRVLRSCSHLAGHNITGFDVPVLRRVGCKVAERVTLEDTLVWSRLCFSDRKEQDFQLAKKGKLDTRYIGQHSLGSWGRRLGIHKTEYTGGFDSFSQEMLDYCIQDVKVNRTLWRFLRNLLPSWKAADGLTTIEIEQFFAQFCDDLETTGILIDGKVADELLGTLLKRRAELDDELHKVFPPVAMKYAINCKTGKQTYRKDENGVEKDHKLVPFNPGSRQQLANRLVEKYGWVPEDFTKTGDPVMAEEVLLGLSDVYPEAKIAAERFVVQARIGIVEEGNGSYLRLADKNGRLHGRFVHIGTVTHRCAHKQPNLGNPTSVNKPYGRDIRRLFRADPGYLFAGGDASGLELRMLGHYLAKWDGGAYAHVVDAGDPHSLHRDAINSGTGLGVDRNTTKTLGYAWLYGAGDEKLGRTVGRDHKMGSRIRKALRTKIEGMSPLLSALEDAVEKRGYLMALDGRRVGIRKKHSALNTLLQSAGAVVMRWFPFYLRRRLHLAGLVWGVDYIPQLHVHDELQGSLRPHLTETFKSCFEQAFTDTERALGLRVPLKCEVKFGSNWAETH